MDSTRSGPKRCSLIGYSFGGVVCCKMAGRLSQEGRSLDALVLVDPCAPSLHLGEFEDDPHVRAYRDGTFERRLARPRYLSSVRGRIQNGFRSLRHALSLRSRVRRTKLRIERTLSGGHWNRRLSFDEELSWFLREVVKPEGEADLGQSNLAVPVHVILAEESFRDDVELRWRLYSGDSTEFSFIPGNHLSIQTEQAEDLAVIMRPLI